MTHQQEDADRYLAACHAMQTGVKYEMESDALRGAVNSATTPKHLRVGVNSAMVSHTALVQLLISKGLLTEEEYYHSQALAMEVEVKRYEKRAGNGVHFS